MQMAMFYFDGQFFDIAAKLYSCLERFLPNNIMLMRQKINAYIGYVMQPLFLCANLINVFSLADLDAVHKMCKRMLELCMLSQHYS